MNQTIENPAVVGVLDVRPVCGLREISVAMPSCSREATHAAVWHNHCAVLLTCLDCWRLWYRHALKEAAELGDGGSCNFCEGDACLSDMRLVAL